MARRDAARLDAAGAVVAVGAGGAGAARHDVDAVAAGLEAAGVGLGAGGVGGGAGLVGAAGRLGHGFLRK